MTSDSSTSVGDLFYLFFCRPDITARLTGRKTPTYLLSVCLSVCVTALRQELCRGAHRDDRAALHDGGTAGRHRDPHGTTAQDTARVAALLPAGKL